MYKYVGAFCAAVLATSLGAAMDPAMTIGSATGFLIIFSSSGLGSLIGIIADRS